MDIWREPLTKDELASLNNLLTRVWWTHHDRAEYDACKAITQAQIVTYGYYTQERVKEKA